MSSCYYFHYSQGSLTIIGSCRTLYYNRYGKYEHLIQNLCMCFLLLKSQIGQHSTRGLVVGDALLCGYVRQLQYIAAVLPSRCTCCCPVSAFLMTRKRTHRILRSAMKHFLPLDAVWLSKCATDEQYLIGFPFALHLSNPELKDRKLLGQADWFKHETTQKPILAWFLKTSITLIFILAWVWPEENSWPYPFCNQCWEVCIHLV